jgi:hypothetical protein
VRAGVALAVFLPWSASATPAPLLDDGADRVHARTDVGAPARRVGEVLLVRRGEATVVQTRLATKLLARVVAEIRAKEERNWPAASPGHVAMLRYVAALDDAVRTGPAPDGDRERRLLIEFVAGPSETAVALATFERGAAPDAPRVPGRRSLVVLPLERAYVTRNMRLILSDAFDRPEHELGGLGPLGVLDAPAPP